MRLWKVIEETQLLFKGPTATIDGISMADEETFVSGGQDGHLAVWSVTKKKPIGMVRNVFD